MYNTQERIPAGCLSFVVFDVAKEMYVSVTDHVATELNKGHYIQILKTKKRNWI